MAIRGVSRLRYYTIELVLVSVLLAAVGFFAYLGSGLMQSATSAQEFSGARALEQAAEQVNFGPRVTGTESSRRMSDWLAQELVRLNWNVLIEPFTLADTIQARNIIAVREPQRPNAPAIILAAHYDTRLVADADPNPANHMLTTLGANAGASGPALLLELARTLDVDASGHTICLVFFDAEENGGLPGWNANVGSRYFLERLDEVPKCLNPRLAVVVDLVGNEDQPLFIEQTGEAAISTALWQVASQKGFGDHFLNEARWTQPSAHTVFQEAGISAAVIADFDYRYRHTVEDTLDKLSDNRLAAVGQTLEAWLEAGARTGQ
jgi:glutaminyl-peptide cyclotransferase